MPSIAKMATSLDILCPAFTTYCSPMKPLLIDPPSVTLTTSDLESRSASIVNAVSQNDFADPELQLSLASDFVSDISSTGANGRGLIRGREAYLKARAQQTPVLGVEVMSAVADVDEDGREADVWLLVSTMDVEGYEKECVIILSWRKDHVGRWWCWRTEGMRGVAGFRV